MSVRAVRAALTAAFAFATGGLLAQLVGSDSSPTRALIWGALAFETFLGLLALSGAMLSRQGALTRLGLGRGRLNASRVALLALGTLALSHALDGVLELSGLDEQSVLRDFAARLAGIDARTAALALLALAVAPGISEELLCRGLVQRGLVARFGALPGIVSAAAIFGALHGEWVHGLFAGCLGLYLGIVAHVAGSVRASIVCHAVNNAAAVGVAASGLELPASSWGGVTLALAAAGALLAIATRGTEKPPPPPAPGLQPAAGSDDA